MSHPLSDMMGVNMEKIRSMVDTNSVIGEPITTPDGVTIIPVSKVSFGFASGGSDYVSKHTSADGTNPFGGGAGAGGTLQTVSSYVFIGETGGVTAAAGPPRSSPQRIIELLPDLTDKLSELLKKDKKPKDIDETGEF